MKIERIERLAGMSGTPTLKGRIWDESKYVPHQGEAEKARRRGETGWWAKRMEATLAAYCKLDERE